MEHIDHYRAASPNDYGALLKLLPQLADFEIPIRRVAKDLWEGDAALLKEVLDKKSRVTFADVAVDSNDQIQGVILVTMREEILSHEPSAHLEAIVVNPDARGQGLARREVFQNFHSSVRVCTGKTGIRHPAQTFAMRA